MLTPDHIPAIAIAIPLAYTAYIWHLCRKHRLVIPFSFFAIFMHVFALQAIMYGMFQFMEIELAVRGFWVRVSNITLALSFSIPLTILYFTARRGRAP